MPTRRMFGNHFSTICAIRKWMGLSATLLDTRNGCRRELSVPLLNEARAYLIDKMKKKHAELTTELDNDTPDENSVGRSVASNR